MSHHSHVMTCDVDDLLPGPVCLSLLEPVFESWVGLSKLKFPSRLFKCLEGVKS